MSIRYSVVKVLAIGHPNLCWNVAMSKHLLHNLKQSPDYYHTDEFGGG